MDDNNKKNKQMLIHDESIRNFENENYLLKLKIEELDQVISDNRRELLSLFSKIDSEEYKTLEKYSNDFHEKISLLNILENEENIKSLILENKELSNKCRNLHENIKNKDERINQLQTNNENIAKQFSKREEIITKLKYELTKYKQDIQNRKINNFIIQSTFNFSLVPIKKINDHYFSNNLSNCSIYNKENELLIITQNKDKAISNIDLAEIKTLNLNIKSINDIMQESINLFKNEKDERTHRVLDDTEGKSINNLGIPFEKTNTLDLLLDNHIESKQKRTKIEENSILFTKSFSTKPSSLNIIEFKQKLSDLSLINEVNSEKKKLLKSTKTKKTFRKINSNFFYRKKIKMLIIQIKKQKFFLKKIFLMKDFLTPTNHSQKFRCRNYSEYAFPNTTTNYRNSIHNQSKSFFKLSNHSLRSVLETSFSIKNTLPMNLFNYDNLFLEYFNFSLEKKTSCHRKFLKSFNRKGERNNQFSFGCKNLEINENESFLEIREVKEPQCEESINVPLTTSNRTIGSTKINNNTVLNTELEINNILYTEHYNTINKNDKLKEFYNKYLKYSDNFMKDSLKQKMLPGSECKKKDFVSRKWSDYAKPVNLNNMLFIRKNGLKLNKN